MMFGLQGAPGVFQELMEILSTKCKENDEVRKILKNGHLASFFDDTGLGTQTEDEHLYLLECYFRVCQESHIRIKLSKCQFLQESIEYLGYDVGWGQWRPSSKRVQAIQKAEVHNLRDLRAFLGATNFYRRHCKNFTYSSAPLTDLLKKNAKWRWGEVEQRAFDELKSKIAAMEVLGVPRPIGELVMVTDSSNIGGGSTIFQWQALDPQQIPEQFGTFGVAQDRTFKHNYPDNFRLVPLGHYNWKWNDTQKIPLMGTRVVSGRTYISVPKPDDRQLACCMVHR